MIANFILMGDLYQHNPFDFLATEWSTYPWQIGFDNGMEISSTEVIRSPMNKTNWDVGLFDDQVLDLGVSADIVSAVMFATLVVFDMWGNLGSDVGNDPDPIPPEEICPTVVGAAVLSVTSVTTLIIEDSNVEQPSEQGFISVTGANVLSVSSIETLVVRDSNVEQSSGQGFVSVTGAAVLSVTSNQV